MNTMQHASLIEEYLRNKRILIVDDEAELGDMIASVFRSYGFIHVETACGSLAAIELIKQQTQSVQPPFQFFVLDVMMPQMDGFSLLTHLHAQATYANTPAVFLTAKDQPHERINGLFLGADDYIAKPFLPQELVLRACAVLRRCYSVENPILQLAYSSINMATAEVTKAEGSTYSLTAKEHEILETLARNANCIVTIDTLCEACWGTSFGYENSLMTHIRRLREKIEQDPSKPVSLITARGLGYKLIKGNHENV